jgi:hypothetical protein
MTAARTIRRSMAVVKVLLSIPKYASGSIDSLSAQECPGRVVGVPSLDILTEEACICAQNAIRARRSVFPTVGAKPFPIVGISAADTGAARAAGRL